MAFNLENYIKSPFGQKSDLLDIAAHYNVPGIKASMRKQAICNMLIQTLIDDNILSTEFMSFVKKDVSDQDIELKLQLEKLRMEREERLELQRLKLEEKKMEREREEREREREREKEREEREIAGRKRTRQTVSVRIEETRKSRSDAHSK